MDLDQSNKTGRLRIAYSCRKATFLIEKKQLTKITTREKFELRIHLAGCSVCKTFEKQSILINQMVKNLFGRNEADAKLDETFKKHLKEQIATRLGNR